MARSQALPWGEPCVKCDGPTVLGVATTREGLVEVCTSCGWRRPAIAAPPAPRRLNDASVRALPKESHRLKRRLERWAAGRAARAMQQDCDEGT